MKMILFKRKRVTVLVCLLVAAAMFLAVSHHQTASHLLCSAGSEDDLYFL